MAIGVALVLFCYSLSEGGDEDDHDVDDNDDAFHDGGSVLIKSIKLDAPHRAPPSW